MIKIGSIVTHKNFHTIFGIIIDVINGNYQVIWLIGKNQNISRWVDIEIDLVTNIFQEDLKCYIEDSYRD